MTVTEAAVLPETIQLPAAVGEYFRAWNAHDTEAVLAALEPDGSYEDPATGGPLRGDALRRYLDGLFAAFPDLSFEAREAHGNGRRWTVEWLMRGTNAAPLQPGLPATGATVVLPGVDVVSLDGDAITSVRGFFDRKAFLEQTGLQVVVQPRAAGPLRFGRGVWLSTGNSAKPAAFSTTWIDVTNEADRQEVIARTHRVIAEMAEMPGFIGATFTDVANRLTTQTAWASVEAAHAVMKLGTHKEALGRFLAGELGVAVHTAVWAPERQNALWVRCAACGKVERYEPDGRSACGEPFPQQPVYW